MHVERQERLDGGTVGVMQERRPRHAAACSAMAALWAASFCR